MTTERGRKLHSIIEREVKQNNEGVYFVDFPIVYDSAALYTPKTEKIKEAGFEVTAVRAGYENKLRIWFKDTKKEGEASE